MLTPAAISDRRTLFAALYGVSLLHYFPMSRRCLSFWPRRRYRSVFGGLTSENNQTLRLLQSKLVSNFV
jgi:hypothetical protein